MAVGYYEAYPSVYLELQNSSWILQCRELLLKLRNISQYNYISNVSFASIDWSILLKHEREIEILLQQIHDFNIHDKQCMELSKLYPIAKELFELRKELFYRNISSIKNMINSFEINYSRDLFRRFKVEEIILNEIATAKLLVKLLEYEKNLNHTLCLENTQEKESSKLSVEIHEPMMSSMSSSQTDESEAIHEEESLDEEWTNCPKYYKLSGHNRVIFNTKLLRQCIQKLRICLYQFDLLTAEIKGLSRKLAITNNEDKSYADNQEDPSVQSPFSNHLAMKIEFSKKLLIGRMNIILDDSDEEILWHKLISDIKTMDISTLAMTETLSTGKIGL